MTAAPLESSGPSVDAAVSSALEQLGLGREQVYIDVLSTPRRMAGGDTRPARVRVTPRDSGPQITEQSTQEPQMTDTSSRTDEQADTVQSIEPAPSAAALSGDGGAAEAPAEELSPEERMNQLDEEADLAADFVEGLLDRLDLPGDIEIEISDEQALLNLDDVGSGLLIGRRGATLDALQELVRCAVQRQTERRARVRVDVEGYRSRHVEKLRDRCREAIAHVRETGEPVRLEPMDAYERKLMHDLVAKTGGVTSSSEGAEPKRRVVIHPAE